MSSKRLLLGWQGVGVGARGGGGRAGQLVLAASSGVWEWAVHHRPGDRRSEARFQQQVLGCSGCIMLWHVAVCSQRCCGDRKREAHEAEGILGPAQSHQFAAWNWHSSVLFAYY